MPPGIRETAATRLLGTAAPSVVSGNEFHAIYRLL
jgi:hypothetical protein